MGFWVQTLKEICSRMDGGLDLRFNHGKGLRAGEGLEVGEEGGKEGVE